MFGLIKTQPQLQEAILSSYLFDLIIAVAFIVLLIIIAHLIPWQGGKEDTSGKKRRLWFWNLGTYTLFSTLAFNYFCFFKKIAVPTFKMDYMLHLVLGAILASIIYTVVLFVIIKLQKKKTKLSSIYPPKR